MTTVKDEQQFRTLDRNASIAVIGGSLVGPLLSLLLRRAGFANVDVYEATPATVSQAGGVIRLGRRALGVLDAIGIGQDEVVPFPSERIVSVKIADGRESGRFHTVFPGLDTTWTLLHGALTERLPEDKLHTGKRVTAIDSDEQDRARLSFADGEQVTPDLVAFADGRRSLGRRVLDPDRQLQYAGYVAFRGQLDECPDDIREFVRFEPEGTQLITAPVPMGDGRVGMDWTFYLNASPDRFHELFGASPTTRTFVLPHQIGDAARNEVDRAAEALLPAQVAELIHRTTMRSAAPIVDIAPPERMVSPVGDCPAVLIGDALALVRPHTARGLNNGITQADGLVGALIEHSESGIELGAALASWQARNLPQVAAAIQLGPELAQAIGLGR